MRIIKRKTIAILCFVIAILFSACGIVKNCSAEGFAISPINQDKVLTPGSDDIVTIILIGPTETTTPTDYEISIKPFTVIDNEEIRYENKEDYSQIVDWVTPEETSGTINPDEKKEIAFKIKVPKDAPAGGQYFAIVVTVNSVNTGMIQEKYAMAHLVYAEIAGETIRKGQLNLIEVPGFINAGNISGSASITNLGNVHSRAKHTLKIYPLFGNEEYYTNEDKPQENVIMPGATRLSGIAWEDTPSIGIFRVKYAVEFEGAKNEIEKIVIICPLWLTIVIILIIVTILYRLIAGIKKLAKKTKTPAEA